jgi:hypothetical protein
VLYWALYPRRALIDLNEKKRVDIPLIGEPHNRHDAAARDRHYTNQDDTGWRDIIGTIANPPLRKGIINNMTMFVLIGN